MNDRNWMAPLRDAHGSLSRVGVAPWEGLDERKPWDYRATAAVVHLDTPDLLAVVVDTLRAQTLRPYILVVDAGSADLQPVLDLEAPDLEVISLRPRSWRYTSEPVAVGMDCAFARCQTEFLYATHVDVFLKRPDYLAWLAEQCDRDTPAVGYQMSPRPEWGSDLWKRILSHTATMYHMPTMRAIGAQWNMTAAFERLGITPSQPRLTGFPDTEVNLGLGLHAAGLGERWSGDDPGDKPSVLMLGEELNVPYETPWLEHIRSTTGNRVHNRPLADARGEILARSVAEAKERVVLWREGGSLPPIEPHYTREIRTPSARDVALAMIRQVGQCTHRSSACSDLAQCDLGMGDLGWVPRERLPFVPEEDRLMYPHGRKRWGATKPVLGTQINPSHPCSTGLLAFYALNEFAGRLVYNSAGPGPTGRIDVTSGTVSNQWAARPSDSGVNGSNGAVQYIDLSAFATGLDLSGSCSFLTGFYYNSTTVDSASAWTGDRVNTAYGFNSQGLLAGGAASGGLISFTYQNSNGAGVDTVNSSYVIKPLADNTIGWVRDARATTVNLYANGQNCGSGYYSPVNIPTRGACGSRLLLTEWPVAQARAMPAIAYWAGFWSRPLTGAENQMMAVAPYDLFIPGRRSSRYATAGTAGSRTGASVLLGFF